MTDSDNMLIRFEPSVGLALRSFAAHTGTSVTAVTNAAVSAYVASTTFVAAADSVANYASAVIAPAESSPSYRLAVTALAGQAPTHAAAVLLGRAGGLKGGPARKNRLSAEERTAIARKAANARWAKQRALAASIRQKESTL